MADSAPRAHGRAAFLFIFITVALDMLALGLIIPQSLLLRADEVIQ